MQQGRGGMGSHKHGISGYAPRSPRYKFMQTFNDNRERDAKPKPKMRWYESVAAAFREWRKS